MKSIVFNKLALVSLSLLSSMGYALEEKPNPKLTEVWEPVPPKVTFNGIPSDAIALLSDDEKGVNENWQHVNSDTVKWSFERGELTVLPKSSSLLTKASFCDMQLHLEWKAPKNPSSYNANSGIIFQKRYEVQILETYGNPFYVNGIAGSVYKQSPPFVDALMPAGQWQKYDIVYKAPRFTEGGELATPAHITVFVNGVVVQHNFEVKGTTLYRGEPSYPVAHGCEPLVLQDHGDPISFRNIWVRHL